MLTCSFNMVGVCGTEVPILVVWGMYIVVWLQTLQPEITFFTLYIFLIRKLTTEVLRRLPSRYTVAREHCPAQPKHCRYMYLTCTEVRCCYVVSTVRKCRVKPMAIPRQVRGGVSAARQLQYATPMPLQVLYIRTLFQGKPVYQSLDKNLQFFWFATEIKTIPVTF